MSLIHEQAAFMRDVRKLLSFADEHQLLVTGGELARFPETQSQNVRDGRNSTLDSMHLRRCAIDLNFFIDRNGNPEWVHTPAELEPLGSYWETLDPRNRWGGRNKVQADLPHFERDLGPWPVSSTSTLLPPPIDLDLAGVSTPERLQTISLASPPGSVATLRRGSGDRNRVLVLQEKLVKLKLLDTPSGEFDAKTESAVCSFQRQQQLVADGIAGPKTLSIIDDVLAGKSTPTSNRWLSDDDLDKAAAALQLESAVVRAVYKVESNGRGFVDDQAKILFEGHVFWQRLKVHGVDPQRLAAGNADILYPKWTKAFYGNAAHERDRLRRAEAIHETAARESASWGLFQILGYHWSLLNEAPQMPKYASVNDFVTCMNRHERDQLDAFCRFVVADKSSDGVSLSDLLRKLDWPAFAYRYNGSGYRANAYDDKLRSAYLGFKARAE